MPPNFFKRELSKSLKRFSKFPVLALLGPRQSGKTTLARHHFRKHQYVNLELPELRSFAQEDPHYFLRQHENKHGLIIDEFQHAPTLLSYIQVSVDEQKRPGYFVLTGSQNFLVNQLITQSLAGRIGILTLLPFSLQELKANRLLSDMDSTLLNGSYPRLYEEDIAASDFYPSYIHTYLERDVRQIANVSDLIVFQKLMRLCAARIGQLVNIAELSTQLGVDQRGVKEWLAVLEASYILFLLKPHHRNFNKRLTKTPKLYFYDTGLACSLLDIRTTKSLMLSPYRGNLFESLMISDLQKQYFNLGIGTPSTYFWRDQNGRVEVDCIVDRGDALFPIEIKSSETINASFFDALIAWKKIANSTSGASTLIYGGQRNELRSQARILGWNSATRLISDLIADS